MLPSCSQDSWPAANRSSRAKSWEVPTCNLFHAQKSELSETDVRDLGNLQCCAFPGSASKNPPPQDEMYQPALASLGSCRSCSRGQVVKATQNQLGSPCAGSNPADYAACLNANEKCLCLFYSSLARFLAPSLHRTSTTLAIF